ncbi:MAG: ABC transporter permease [Phycisphaerae bacterium]
MTGWTSHPVISLAAKDLKLLLRDKAGFGFTFFFPIAYCIFFGAMFSQSSGGESEQIRLVIADEDQSSASMDFVARLGDSGDILIEPRSFEEGRDLVRRGKRVAVVRLPKGFGEDYDRMFQGEPARLELVVDPARRAEAGMLQGMLLQVAFEGMQRFFGDAEAMQERVDGWMTELDQDESLDPVRKAALKFFLPTLAGFTAQMASATGDGDADGSGGSGMPAFEPVRITEIPVMREQKQKLDNPYKISFPQGIVWGIMGCAAGFGISLVQERTAGTLIRLRTSPIPAWHLLAGKSLACFTTIIFLMIMLFTIGALGYRVYPQSAVKLVLAALCIATCFSGIMLLLSVLGKTEQAAGGISWGILVVLAMIGGGMIPLMFMPGWMKTVSHISPVKWSLLAMEGAVWRGFTFGEMVPVCAVLLGIGVGAGFIGTRLFRWSEAA